MMNNISPIRGGAWVSDSVNCRSAICDIYGWRDNRSFNLGFRVVVLIERLSPLRGGSWAMTYDLCRSGVSEHNDLEYRSRYNGFRVVLIPMLSPLRGGSWYNNPINCRSASRDINIRRAYRDDNGGFRVVAVVNESSPMRGGSWGSHPSLCPSAFRVDYNRRGLRSNGDGFRVVTKMKDTNFLRGGSWLSYLGCCDTTYRSYTAPDYISSRIGFRVTSSKPRLFMRGGSWFNLPNDCLSEIRSNNNRRDDRNYDLGFRVVSVNPRSTMKGGSWVNYPSNCSSVCRIRDGFDHRRDGFGLRVVSEKKSHPGFAKGGSLAAYKLHCRSECHVSHKWFIGRGSVFGFRVVTQNGNKKIKGGSYESFTNVCRSEFVDLYIDKSLRDNSAGFRVVADHKDFGFSRLHGGSFGNTPTYCGSSSYMFRVNYNKLVDRSVNVGFRVASTACIKPIKLKGGAFLTSSDFVGSDYTTIIIEVHAGECVDGFRIVCSS